MAIGALALSACSSADSGTGGSTSEATTPTVDTGQAIQTYFEALAANDTKALIAASSPGSPARDFSMMNGQVQQIEKPVVGTASTTDTEATLTRSDTETVYKNIKIDSEGRIADWTSSPGGPLKPRIVAKRKTFRLGPLKATVDYQYVDPDKKLSVTMVLTNPSRQNLKAYTTSYVSPNGQQSAATLAGGGWVGAVDILAKAKITAGAVAEGGKPGGRLAIRVTSDRGGGTVADAVLQLPK